MHWPDGLKWRMTNGAARVRLRFADSYGLGNSRRAGIEQNGKSVRMKILARPGDILAALFARTAVTTGRFAPNCTDEERAGLGRLFHFFSKKSCAQCKKAREKNDKATHGWPIHRARLKPPAPLACSSRSLAETPPSQDHVWKSGGPQKFPAGRRKRHASRVRSPFQRWRGGGSSSPSARF